VGAKPAARRVVSVNNVSPYSGPGALVVAVVLATMAWVYYRAIDTVKRIDPRE